MTPPDLFIDADRGADGLPRQKANSALLSALVDGTYTATPEAEVALLLAEQLASDLTIFGTSGSCDFSADEMKAAIRALKASCTRLGIPLQIPFRDYAGFEAYWKRKGASGSGGYDKRRIMVSEFLDPTIEALEGRVLAPHSHSLPEVALDALTDASAIHDSLKRASQAVDKDARLAVSAAKDLIESTAKLVLSELGLSYSGGEDLPQLAARAQSELGLTKKAVTEASGGSAESSGQLLGALSGMVSGIAQLRNAVGVGHGRESVPEWVKPRHARLAVGLATTWCSLVLETLDDPGAPWRSSGV